MITRLGSVEEAVEYAVELKQQSTNLVFRGQKQDWPIVPSFLRLSETKREEALKMVRRFNHWVGITPGLEKLTENCDAQIAVAQHYGIPTNFIDFSTEPAVAGYFATETADELPDGGEACIICLDPIDLDQLWRGMMPKYPSPELLRIEVENLWRMEAQHGVLLYCPYTELDTRIYRMDRIYFPRTHRYTEVEREEIYPSRKSSLEILLDQFFMNERMIEFRESFDWSLVQSVKLQSDETSSQVFPCGLPMHSTWKEIASDSWLVQLKENYRKVSKGDCVTIKVLHSDPIEAASSISKTLKNKFVKSNDFRSSLVTWQVVFQFDNTFPPSFCDELAKKLALVWDGMRILPYSFDNIISALANVIAYGMALRGDLQNVSGDHWKRAAEVIFGETLYVEFGGDDGSYSRGYISVEGLKNAIREDVGDFINPELINESVGEPVNLLRFAINPKSLFDAEAFCTLFANEAIPIQAMMRKYARFYSPLRLTKFGLA